MSEKEREEKCPICGKPFIIHPGRSLKTGQPIKMRKCPVHGHFSEVTILLPWPIQSVLKRKEKEWGSTETFLTDAIIQDVAMHLDADYSHLSKEHPGRLIKEFRLEKFLENTIAQDYCEES